MKSRRDMELAYWGFEDWMPEVASQAARVVRAFGEVAECN